MDSSNKIFDTILYHIYEVPRLRSLFLRWSLLNQQDRLIIDGFIEANLQDNKIQLYQILREALGVWDHLQDTEGAPGFEPDTEIYSCENLEQDFTFLIMTLESYVENFLKKYSFAYEDEEKHNLKSTSSSTTSLIFKNESKSESHITDLEILQNRGKIFPQKKSLSNATVSKSNSFLQTKTSGYKSS